MDTELFSARILALNLFRIPGRRQIQTTDSIPKYKSESNLKHKQNTGTLVAKGNSIYVDIQERLGNILRGKDFLEGMAFDQALSG